MSRNSAHYPQDTQSQSPLAEVIPFYVCPGMKDVPLTYAVFPYGDNCSSPAACPAREICQWYAAHDLGGEVQFNELPEAILLRGDFRSRPFRCSNFNGEEEAAQKRCRRRKSASATVVA